MKEDSLVPISPSPAGRHSIVPAPLFPVVALPWAKKRDLPEARFPAAVRYRPHLLLAAYYGVMILFVINMRNPLNPIIRWHDWWDQAWYERSARAFHHLNLAASEHYYPFLYSLIAAPFVWLSEASPFFIPNLMFFILAFEGFRRVARGFSVSTGVAALLFAFSTLLFQWEAELWIVPWTTTISAAILWLSLGLVADLRERRGVGHAILLGCLLAGLPFTRPGDVPAGAIIGLCGLASLAGRREWRAIGWAMAGGIVTLLVLGGLYVAIYGLEATAYMRLSAAYGYDFEVFGWRAEMLLSSPRGWFVEGTGLVERAPWLVLGAASMVYLGWTGVVARRVLPIALAGSTTLYLVLMLAYNDLLPPHMWRFHCEHYFKWLLPAYALGAVVLLASARRRPIVLTALIPVVALSMVYTAPVTVSRDAPARMLYFATPPGAEENPTYFAASLIFDRSGVQRNIFDYRQMRTGPVTRAISLGRSFSGGEHWIGNGNHYPVWPNVYHAQDGSVVLAGPWPRSPLARFGSSLGFGVPCWVPFVNCDAFRATP